MTYHKWKIIYVLSAKKTIRFRLQFNLFPILKQNFTEDIWKNPELSERSHSWILATAYMVFQILWLFVILKVSYI